MGHPMKATRIRSGRPVRARRAAAWIVLALLLPSLSGATVSGAPDPSPATTSGAQLAAAADGMRRVAASDDVELWLEPESGMFDVRFPGVDRVLRSGPSDWDADPVARGVWKTAGHSLLVIEYTPGDGSVQTTDSWTDSVSAGGAIFEERPDGFTARFEFPELGFVIPLDVTLTEGRLELRIRTSAIEQRDVNRLLSISVDPMFGAGGPDAEGYMVVPSGSGGVIRYNNGKAAAGDYIGRIYGDDAAVAPRSYIPVMEPARLPVFGAAEGELGYIARISSGDSLATVRASVNGGRSVRNIVYAQFHLVGTDRFSITDSSGKDRDYLVLDRYPRDLGDLAIEYAFLSADRDVTYADLAATLRGRLLQVFPGLADGTQVRRDMLVDFYAAVRKTRSFLGIPVRSRTVLTTLEDAARMADDLEGSGTGPLTVRLRYATRAEVDHDPFASTGILAKLGGDRGLSSLAAPGRRIFLSLEPTLYRKGGWLSSGISRAAQGVMGLPAYLPQYDLETNLRAAGSDLLLAPALAAERLSLALDRTTQDREELGVSVQSVGEGLYSDYGATGALRPQAASLWQGAFSTLAERDRRMSTGGNLYLAAVSGSVSDVATTSAPYVLIDTPIPFLQLTFSGLITFYSKPINLSSNPTRSLLNAVETGTLLHFAFIAESPEILRGTELDWLYSASYDAWREDCLDDQTRYRTLLDLAEGTRPVDHGRTEDGTAGWLVYENGLTVLVNYGTGSRTLEGVTVPPMDFAYVMREVD